MKTVIYILLFSFSFTLSGEYFFTDRAKDLIVNTQSEIDKLKFTREVGNLIIASEGVDQILDLSNLNSIKEIQGNLYVINNTDLQSLNGLDSINLKGSVFIQGNKSLKEVNTYITNNIIGDFIVKNNDSLKAITGLSKVESIKDLILENNKSLQNLNSFESIKEISGSVNIIGNKSFKYFKPFIRVVYFEGDLKIQNNKSLYDAQVVYKLHSMAKSSVITNNTIYTSDIKLMKIAYEGAGSLRFNRQDEVDEFGLSYQKNSFRGDVLIDRSRVKNLDGLSVLSEINGRLIIKRNDSLESVNGLSNLKKLNHLIISFNKSLSDLNGLENLSIVEKDIVIYRNTDLIDTSSLSHKINMGGKLVIQGNPKLQNN